MDEETPEEALDEALDEEGAGEEGAILGAMGRSPSEVELFISPAQRAERSQLRAAAEDVLRPEQAAVKAAQAAQAQAAVDAQLTKATRLSAQSGVEEAERMQFRQEEAERMQFRKEEARAAAAANP